MRDAPGLRRTLWASVIYDLSAFVLLLWMPAWLLELFSHPVPAEPFLFRLAALPLVLLPLIYAMAARDPVERWMLTVASFRLRLWGGVTIAAVVAWQKPEVPAPYLVFAIGDWVWAGLVWLAARPVGRSLWRP